jgi:hypothetical protein
MNKVLLLSPMHRIWLVDFRTTEYYTYNSINPDPIVIVFVSFKLIYKSYQLDHHHPSPPLPYPLLILLSFLKNKCTQPESNQKRRTCFSEQNPHSFPLLRFLNLARGK